MVEHKEDLSFEELSERFKEASRHIRALESCFNQAVDSEIVEYYIMRIKAEETRREYFYRKLRELEKSCVLQTN